jgi:hypothetical protein
MTPVGFEPTISAGEQPNTYALNRAATGTGRLYKLRSLINRDWITQREKAKDAEEDHRSYMDHRCDRPATDRHIRGNVRRGYRKLVSRTDIIFLLVFKLSPCSKCYILSFWAIPRRLKFIFRRFGTLCSIFTGR